MFSSDLKLLVVVFCWEILNENAESLPIRFRGEQSSENQGETIIINDREFQMDTGLNH